MKKIICALGFAFALSAHSAAKVGENAPEFTLTDTNGKTHSLKDFRGKTVVLEWLNHDCPYVVKHYGSNNMQTLQKTYTGKGVVWLSINSSAEGKQGNFPPEKANELTKAKGAAASAVLLDASGSVGKSYGAKTTPHMYVIDPKGVLAYNGAIDDKPSTDAADIKTAKNLVAAAVDEVLASKPVTVSTSKPYGCSVKY
jgi:peroxiredoxin